jgi:aryl-alcohol dehydrogenase-like predicted oxidoreductase
MKYIKIGNSGLKVSEISLGSSLTIGTELLDFSVVEGLIDTAWNSGIRSFDTSNNYGNGNSEILLSKALSKYPRHNYVLATKGSWPIGDSPYEKGLSRKHVIWALDESLKRMKVDYIDIYYAHRFDPEVPMEEIVRTYNFLINSGKIRYWATSEWPVNALVKCISICDTLKLERPILDQFIYSYAVRKAENNGVKSFLDSNGMGSLGFSPLCQGYLTGKYRNGVPNDSRISKGNKIGYNKTTNFYNDYKDQINYFLTCCDKYSANYTSVALQWCLRKGVFPIIGASKAEQIAENIKSLTVSIPEELWIELEIKKA